MESRVKTGFGSYSNENLLTLAKSVVEQITLHKSKFSNEVLTQKDKLQPMCNEFNHLINLANMRTTVDITKRNQYRVLFEKQINVIATIINLEYKGMDDILELSGFVVMKAPRKLSLTPIEDVVLKQSTQQGFIDVRMKGGNNYKSVDVIYSTQKDLEVDKWNRKMITKKTTSLGKFEKATSLYVKLVAYGKDNTSVESLIKYIGVQ